MVATVIAGLRTTDNFATDERPKNFREFILFRNPNGSAPITALMAKARSESVDDPEFSWWDEPNDILRLQVNGAVAASGTLITIDSSDPSASAPGNRWATANHLVPGDMLLVEKTETATYDNEVVMVRSVISSTQFIVDRGVGGTTAATLPDDSYLTKIGTAFGEGSAAPRSSSRNPLKQYNYCQIFKTTYALSETVARTRARTGDPQKNDKKRKAFDHARDIEFALMFGTRYETTDDDGNPLRTMGGLRYLLPSSQQKIYGGTATFSTFLDDVYPVFDFDTEAGDERIVFCGNGFLNEMNKMAKNNGTMYFGDTIKMFGMNLRQLVLPQGTLYLKTHPLMNRHARYTNSAFILDPTAMIWRYMRDTKSKENIQGNDEDSRKGMWLTEAGLELRYFGLTCKYLGNFTAA